MQELEGKTVVITGASSGYGQGAALAFAKEKCNLVLTARREEKLKKTVCQCEHLGGKVIYFVGDVREEQTAIKTIHLAITTFGKIDVLVNNAGIGRMQTIEEATLEDYDLIMDTNVRSAFAFSKYAIPEMRKNNDGQIIMVSSVTGILGHANEVAYAASKFAIRGLGQALDQELCQEGIRTCVLCPHAGVTEFEIGYGRDKEEWAQKADGLLTPMDVGEAMVSICKQNKNSRVTEMRLAGYNCLWH